MEWGAGNRGKGRKANCGSKCVATLAVHSLLYLVEPDDSMGTCIIIDPVTCSLTFKPVYYQRYAKEASSAIGNAAHTMLNLDMGI